jgi:aminoglycoside phosphotransferase (APT) family kinase protein
MDATGKSKVAGQAQPEWPFSHSELTAGLRRFLAASSLRVQDIQPVPLPPHIVASDRAGTTLRAMAVVVQIDGEEQTLSLLLKEPPVTARGRVLTAVGQREYGVYRKIAPLLPVLVPGFIAGDEEDGWIIIEAVSGLRPPTEWTVEDYREAILNMAAMHESFWGAGEALRAFPWLARPLDADLEPTISGVRETVRRLTMNPDRIPALSEERHLNLFVRLSRLVFAVILPLQEEEQTLVHGDYWPGNIARPIDGRQMVFDWQRAGIAPAIIDLVGFAQSTRMSLDSGMPVDDMIALYRDSHKQNFGRDWDDAQFERLWDHALIWLFMVNWLGRLATIKADDYERIRERFSDVWLDPVFAAVDRRLPA